jgi:hypothetical protein
LVYHRSKYLKFPAEFFFKMLQNEADFKDLPLKLKVKEG